MLQIGQVVEVNTMIEPKSEFWENGYWKIPKGYKTKVLDIEKGEEEDILIEYIDATFYVESRFLNGL
jgi:hypothetical protein